jgi:phosphoribosyl 1,2-cyclic phosphate phosphodiesterase
VKLTFLGTGTSFGVPQLGCACAVCRSTDPRDKRTRVGAAIETDSGAVILVDTPPELRLQLLATGISDVSAVVFTHDHADHTHGIDDLRPLVLHMRRRIPAYADATTATVLQARFGYCFATPPGSSYPPILDEHRIVVPRPVAIEGPGGAVEAQPFRMIHGPTDAIGFRFGGLAYAPDVSRMPPESVEALRGLDVLIVDALRYTPHPTHFSVGDALAFIEEVRPRRAVLTNLHSDINYETLRAELPQGVVPAFDGMRIEG